MDGVTLLELLLALALMALLCCIGVPSFSSIRQEQQLLAAAHALRADIELARHEAQHASHPVSPSISSPVKPAGVIASAICPTVSATPVQPSVIWPEMVIIMAVIRAISPR